MVAKQSLYFPKGSATAVKQLNGTGLQKRPIVATELFVIDRAAALLIAVAADCKVLTAAHLFDTAQNRVAALVVHASGDQIKKLVPFTLHISRQQKTASRDRGEQKVKRQSQTVFQDTLALREKGIFRKTGIKTTALNLADPTDNGLDDGSVEFFHSGAQRLHIGKRRGSAPQDKRDQCVHRCGFPVQLRQKTDTEAGGFELILPQMGQPDTGPNLCSGIFHRM